MYNLEENKMYLENIGLHLTHLQTNEKKIIFVKKKNCKIVIFLNKTLVKCAYYIQRDEADPVSSSNVRTT